MKKTQLILETFEDLREEQKTYVEYEGDLPEEFLQFVARVPNLREFLLQGYEILVRTRSYPAKDMRAILKFVAVGRLRYAPSTFEKDLPDALRNKIKAEWGRRGAYVTNIAKSKRKEDQKKFEDMSSKGGKHGSSADKIHANAKSYEARVVNRYGELYDNRPTVGNKDFDHDLSLSPLTETLRMEVSKQTQNQILLAFEEARKQARKEKKTPFIDFSGIGGKVTKITPLVA